MINILTNYTKQLILEVRSQILYQEIQVMVMFYTKLVMLEYNLGNII